MCALSIYVFILVLTIGIRGSSFNTTWSNFKKTMDGSQIHLPAKSILACISICMKQGACSFFGYSGLFKICGVDISGGKTKPLETVTECDNFADVVARYPRVRCSLCQRCFPTMFLFFNDIFK